VVQKNPKRKIETRVVPIGCTDWYLLITYYDEEGNPIDYEAYFLGTTCVDCNDPEYQSLCGSQGGGGGGEETCYLDTEGVPTSETVSITTFFEDIANGIRGKKYVWTFMTGGGETWWFNSIDSGYHKKVGNEWRWLSLKHIGESKQGVSLGGSVQCKNVIATPTVGIYWAIMALNYDIEWSIICAGFPVGQSDNYGSSKAFNVND